MTNTSIWADTDDHRFKSPASPSIHNYQCLIPIHNFIYCCPPRSSHSSSLCTDAQFQRRCICVSPAPTHVSLCMFDRFCPFSLVYSFPLVHCNNLPDISCLINLIIRTPRAMIYNLLLDLTGCVRKFRHYGRRRLDCATLSPNQKIRRDNRLDWRLVPQHAPFCNLRAASSMRRTCVVFLGSCDEKGKVSEIRVRDRSHGVQGSSHGLSREAVCVNRVRECSHGVIVT